MDSNELKNPKPFVSKYLHYSGKRDSAFGNLPGHHQRYINTEANIVVSAYKHSEKYGAWAQNEKNSKNLLGAVCEFYAEYSEKHPNFLKRLQDKEHLSLFLVSSKNREMSREIEAEDMARRVDEIGRTNSPVVTVHDVAINLINSDNIDNIKHILSIHSLQKQEI